MAIDFTDPVARAAVLENEGHILRVKDEAKRAVAAEKRGRVTPPETLTLRERLTRPQTVTPWRISQLQAVGHRVLLAAQFKTGKTTLAANVVRSLLDGDAFLDTYDVAAIDGVLVLLDFEMSGNQLDDWYRAQKISNDDRLLVVPMRGAASSFNLLDDEVRAHWVQLLKAQGVKYLILDCLRPVLDALGLNEHTEAGLFLTALDALLREAEIPEALVIQHMGHKNERARGDSRLLDWPDVGWTLVREDEDDPASARFFKAYGRDVEVPETKLAYNLTTRRLGVAGGSRADQAVLAALVDVRRFVAEAEQAEIPPSGADIEKKVMPCGHTQKNTRTALKVGVAKGHLAEQKGKNGGLAYRLAKPSAAASKMANPTFLTSLDDCNEVEKTASETGRRGSSASELS